MNYYSPAPPRFAYCYQEMMPVNMPATGEWPDHNSEAAPRPPNDWEPRGFGSGWREWRNPSGPIGRIVPRKSFLLVWHQRTQEFWVRAENGEWNTLFCQHLADNGGHSRRRPGLWRLAECGPQRQHDSQCPSGFDKFLPQNFFKNLGASSCHFVGHLSLILALVAMCPENADAIPDYIERIFYCNNQPEYRPDPNISARNKWSMSLPLAAPTPCSADRASFPGPRPYDADRSHRGLSQ